MVVGWEMGMEVGWEMGMEFELGVKEDLELLMEVGFQVGKAVVEGI